MLCRLYQFCPIDKQYTTMGHKAPPCTIKTAQHIVIG